LLVKITSLITTLATTAMLLTACSQGPLTLRAGDEPTSNQEKQQFNSVIGFDEVNARVFSKYCQSCHSGRDNPIMTDFNSYAAQSKAIFSSVVSKRTMPKKAQMSEEEVALVSQWIQQGSQAVGSKPIMPSPPSTVPENEVVTFARLNKEFYQAKCTICHYPDNPERLSDYSTFDKFRDSIGTILATTHIYITMPPPPTEDQIGELNPNQLTRTEKELINRWVLDGQKEK
jgi:uncharacterized membrane protein